MRRRVIFSLAVLFAYPLFAQGLGTIRGGVELEKDGKKTPLSGISVRLQIFESDRIVAGAEGKTDSLGHYQFPNQKRTPGMQYQAQAMYHHVPFDGKRSTFHPGQSELLLQKIVATPVTGNPSNVEADDLLIYEFGKSNVIKITHSLKLLNSGEETYDPRADGGVPISISLPKGSFRLEFINGLTEEMAEIDSERNLLKLKVTVKPGPLGETKIEYHFYYSYDTRSSTFSFPLSIPRKRFALVLADHEYRVKSQYLKRQEPQNFSGTRYYYFTGGPFKAGELLSFTISGLPLPKDFPRELVLGGCATVLLGALFLLFQKQKETTKLKKGDLIELFVELEEKVRNGKISPPDYQDQRERLMEAWIQL